MGLAGLHQVGLGSDCMMSVPGSGQNCFETCGCRKKESKKQNAAIMHNVVNLRTLFWYANCNSCCLFTLINFLLQIQFYTPPYDHRTTKDEKTEI